VITNIKAIYDAIKADIFDLQEINTTLLNQIGDAKNIFPIMESKNRFIADSLKFIMDFNSFKTTSIISEHSIT
jgi:hypothetical protein